MKSECLSCLWTSGCVASGNAKSVNYLEDHRCCFTCSKKSKCEWACKDRENPPHQCSYLIANEELERRNSATKIPIKSSASQLSRKITSSSQTKISSNKPLKLVTESKAKSLWNIPAVKIPSSIKELIAATGVSSGRANYLIRTKGLTLQQAFELLTSEKK